MKGKLERALSMSKRREKRRRKKRGKQVCVRRTQLPMRFQFDLFSLELRELKKQTKNPPAHITKNLTKTTSPNRSVPRSSAGSAASPIQPHQHERDRRGPRCSHGSSQPPIERDRNSSPSTTANRRYQTRIFSPFPNKGTSPVPCSQLSFAQPPQASALHMATATATAPRVPQLGSEPLPTGSGQAQRLLLTVYVRVYTYVYFISIQKYYFPLKKVVPTGPQSAPSQGMFVFIFFAVNEFCSWQ